MQGKERQNTQQNDSKDRIKQRQ